MKATLEIYDLVWNPDAGQPKSAKMVLEIDKLHLPNRAVVDARLATPEQWKHAAGGIGQDLIGGLERKYGGNVVSYNAAIEPHYNVGVA